MSTTRKVGQPAQAWALGISHLIRQDSVAVLPARNDKTVLFVEPPVSGFDGSCRNVVVAGWLGIVGCTFVENFYRSTDVNGI